MNKGAFDNHRQSEPLIAKDRAVIAYLGYLGQHKKEKHIATLIMTNEITKRSNKGRWPGVGSKSNLKQNQRPVTHYLGIKNLKESLLAHGCEEIS